MEYYCKPPIPPPFVILFNIKYIYQFLRYLVGKCRKLDETSEYKKGNSHATVLVDGENMSPAQRKKIKRKEQKTNSLTM